ncbi:MAG: SDR family oxidoreductase [Cytophagales bacterium]|nr:MAG: SDR family oxidoreductase [Cytophagales bacterium]
MDLKNAKVLVTGGSSGLGLEIAKLLISKGAQVAICGRNKELLNKTAQEIGAMAVLADVSKEAQVISMVKQVIDGFGFINVLINNAGFGKFGLLQDVSVEDFENVIATNVIGSMLCAREVSKHFISHQYGNIINISSTAGKSGFAGGTVYSASKFAVQSMTECWRAELRKYNIRVMLVNPSEVQTNFYTNSGGEERPFNDSKLQASEIAHTICAMLEMNDRGFITEATVFATNPKG